MFKTRKRKVKECIKKIEDAARISDALVGSMVYIPEAVPTAVKENMRRQLCENRRLLKFIVFECDDVNSLKKMVSKLLIYPFNTPDSRDCYHFFEYFGIMHIIHACEMIENLIEECKGVSFRSIELMPYMRPLLQARANVRCELMREIESVGEVVVASDDDSLIKQWRA